MNKVKLAIVYYSAYGTNHAMAEIAEQAAKALGAEVRLRKVQETAPQAVIDTIAPWKEFQQKTANVAVATPDDLVWANAMLFSAPTRFGTVASQVRAFIDTLGPIWQQGHLNRKPVSMMTSAQNLHGGQETTLFSIITNMLHFGMTIVGLDYGFQGQMDNSKIVGGAPYGATTIANGDGSRQPGEEELDGARYLGRRVANTAAKLFA